MYRPDSNLFEESMVDVIVQMNILEAWVKFDVSVDRIIIDPTWSFKVKIFPDGQFKNQDP